MLWALDHGFEYVEIDRTNLTNGAQKIAYIAFISIEMVTQTLLFEFDNIFTSRLARPRERWTSASFGSFTKQHVEHNGEIKFV